MNTLQRFLAILAVTLLPLAGRAQSQAAAMPADLRAMLEAYRSDMNSFKIQTLNQVMALTPEEAERFWPVYRSYEKDLAAVGERKVALIREFLALKQQGPINAEGWQSLARKWLANLQERVDLWKRYQKKIAKEVSPMRAAQFLQVEHQIALIVDLSIASEMPVIQ